LSDYPASHHADFKFWPFATGNEKEINSLTQAFSVHRHTKRGTISLGLATAVISRSGRVEKIWRGNAWTPAEVTEAIQAQTE
jgi:protein SCO1